MFITYFNIKIRELPSYGVLVAVLGGVSKAKEYKWILNSIYIPFNDILIDLLYDAKETMKY